MKVIYAEFNNLWHEIWNKVFKITKFYPIQIVSMGQIDPEDGLFWWDETKDVDL